MRCGHCKNQGVTIAHVRACSEQEQAIRQIGREPLTERDVIDVPVSAPARTLASLIASGETDDLEHVYLACDASTPAAEVSYYKVQQGTNTGNWYAKRWTGGEWEYQGRRPLHFLTREDRLTAEQAARFGHVTGQCVFCSRKLTDERSIEVGYGPRCAEREGLPWG